jgi:ubiquitin carboxyl-terminal hydrolase 5/13
VRPLLQRRSNSALKQTHPEGLFVCMKCFNAFCCEHTGAHAAQHSHPLYLRVLSTPKAAEQQLEITKLAIGVEGGAVGEVEYETSYRVWCSWCGAASAEGEKALAAQVKSLINTDSPFKKQSLASWEVELLPCEHSLTLQQHITNKNLEHCSSCDLSTNLWLCLTCGSAGCGRKNWDGSGGNGHGIGHFEQTGHPLVVKLGTITAEGDASLYCYACNNDVRDELLQEHLFAAGIDVRSQTKTEKTVQEINLYINLNFALSSLVDDREHSEPLYGPGFTGINNIGNSCYLNSVLQTLNALPEFRRQYFEKGEEHTAHCKKIPSECFYCQVSKVFWGLNSGVYSHKQERKRTINEVETTEEFQEGIKPFDFKLLVGKDSEEFMSGRQQDALEYLQWVFDRLDKEEPYFGDSTTSHFAFQTVNRLVCEGCNGYKLVAAKTNEWKFPVPPPSPLDIDRYYQQLDSQSSETRKAKLCEDPEYEVKFQQCLDILKQGDAVVVSCPKCKDQKVFLSRHYFQTTPKYLLAVPNRFILEKWVPKKLNALIQIHEHLNIADFLIQTAAPVGEKLEGAPLPAKWSQENVEMLVGMGFTANAAKRGLIKYSDNLEAASNWIMENIDNYEINKPLEEEKPQQKAAAFSQDAINQILDFGFSVEQAKVALLKNVPLAAI